MSTATTTLIKYMCKRKAVLQIRAMEAATTKRSCTSEIIWGNKFTEDLTYIAGAHVICRVKSVSSAMIPQPYGLYAPCKGVLRSCPFVSFSGAQLSEAGTLKADSHSYICHVITLH